jgi:antitoxin YefM
MDHVSYTELRQNLAHYLDRAVEDCAPVLVTRQGGKGSVVIISAEEFAGWQETIYLLRNPANAAHLLASIASIKAGDVAEQGLVYPVHSDGA